jgi:MFS family permease
MKKYFLMAPSMGIIAGATIAGKMMKTGRRTAFLFFPIVGGVGSLLSVFDSYLIMMVGKFLFGVGAGVCITVAPRIMEETIPSKYFTKYYFGAMTNIGLDTMILAATIMTMFMPKKSNKHFTDKTLGDSTLYKWLYLIPIVPFSVAFVLAIMCFRRESVGFYIHKQDKENSIRAIRQIHMGESHEEYAKRYKKLVDSEEEKPPEAAETGADVMKMGFSVGGLEKDAEKKGKAEEKKLEKDAENAVVGTSKKSTPSSSAERK